MDLARRREGFRDVELGAGVAYLHEIEELVQYDDMAEGDNMPAGHVQVFFGWGTPGGYEIVVTEREYLEALALMLARVGLNAEASQVGLLIR